MAVPVSFVTQTYIDYTREKSTTRLPITTLTAANLVAQMALVTTLLAAQAALTLGSADHSKVQLSATSGGGTPSGNVDAQREKKWLVRYHDTANRKFSVEVPCSDLSLLALNSDFMDTTLAAFTDYKAAFEAVVKSPDDDAAGVTLDTIEFVGRRG